MLYILSLETRIVTFLLGKWWNWGPDSLDYNTKGSQSRCTGLGSPGYLLLCALALAGGFLFSRQRKTCPKCRARQCGRRWESLFCLDPPLELSLLGDIVMIETTVILEGEKRPLNRLLIENSAVTVGLHSFRAELQEDPRSNTGWSKLGEIASFFLKGTIIDVRVFLYHLGFSIFDIIMYYVISPFPSLLQNFPRYPPHPCSFSNSRPSFSLLVVSLLEK